QLAARAAPEVQLTGLAGARERLGVRVGEREHLPRAPVLDDARNEPTLVVADLGVVHSLRADCTRRDASAGQTSRRMSRPSPCTTPVTRPARPVTRPPTMLPSPRISPI